MIEGGLETCEECNGVKHLIDEAKPMAMQQLQKEGFYNSYKRKTGIALHPQ